MFAQEDDYNALDLETEQYQRGYHNAINDFQKKLNLRSRDIVIDKGRLPPNHPSSSQQNVQNKEEKQKEKIVQKVPKNKNKTLK